MVGLAEVSAYVGFSCVLVRRGCLCPVGGVFDVFEMFLETLAYCVGCLAHILFATFGAGYGVDQVVKFTGVVLWYDVSPFGGVASDGSTFVTEVAVPTVGSGADFRIGR